MGHVFNEKGTSFWAPLHHQSQENTFPLQFGFKKRMEGIWSRLRTHIKKKSSK